MKTVNVSIEFDEHKVKALKIYLEKKDTTVVEQMKKALESLYEKSVPAGVRDFLSMSYEDTAKTPKKPKKPPKAETEVTMVNEGTAPT
ncbi:MAG: DUF6103 family protein [Oscillospiraceae bacterium]